MSTPGDWQDEAYWKLRKENERLRACLKECSDELEAYIAHHYDKTLDYPSQKRKYESEMQAVHEARRLLAGTDEQSDANLRTCAACNAVLAPGPQPANTYELSAALDRYRDPVDWDNAD